MPSRIIAQIARKSGGKLLNQAVDTLLPGDQGGKPSLLKGLAGAALVRVATRSVPGAIVVGGGLLAKTLYDRRHARILAKPGKAKAKDQPKA